MEQDLLYQKRIGKTRMEIGGLFGDFLGAIYYQSSDGRFRQGGFDVVVEAMAAMIDLLRRHEPVRRVFAGPFLPMLPQGSNNRAKGEALYEEFRSRVSGRPEQTIGDPNELSGVWLDPSECLGLLAELGPRCGVLSAEDSQMRWVLFEQDEKAAGWDLSHENGTTYLGRWDGNLQHRPGIFVARESSAVEMALDAARVVLERRLTGS